MKVLFLDIDGVLNSHKQLANGYCGIEYGPVELLNALLDDIGDLKLVISSAWRYLVLDGSMTVVGFENLLLTHGLKCLDRVIDVLPKDYPLSDYANGGRERLIEEWITERAWRDERLLDGWAVIDDLPLDLESDHFVQTDATKGLQLKDVCKLCRILTN